MTILFANSISFIFMKKTALYIVALVVLVGILGVVSMFTGARPPVHATTACMTGETQCLAGWAWSSNTGWVSFNSNDGGAGGGPYDVAVSNVGALSGHAWSSNVGWISFNAADLTVTPQCPGTSGVSIDFKTGKVTGWARVMSEMTRNDGWDGCIQMSGLNHESPNFAGYNGTSTLGVTYASSTKVISGFAWAGNVMGWLEFNPNFSNGGSTSCEPNCGGGNTGQVITADCSNSTGGLGIDLASNKPVNFSISNILVDGAKVTGTYTYSWNPLGGTNLPAISGAPYSYTYATAGTYSPTVVISYGTSTSSPISCGTVVVTNSSGTNNNTLEAHYTPTDTGYQSITIHQGDDAYLTWNTGLDQATNQCSGIVTPPSGSTWIDSVWTISQLVTSASPLQVSSSTNQLSKGTYTFQLVCSPIAMKWPFNIFHVANAATNFTSNPVYIKVVSSSLHEI
jgi:hypothetical protein